MGRCPVCYGWVSKKATKCKHCNATLKRNNADDQIISYINNGFDVIERECMEFENEINKMTEGYFKRHEYADEELVHSPHIDKIKSIAGKIGSDIGDWDVRGILSQTVRKYYENKMGILKQHLLYIMERIKTRRKTAWDYVKNLLLSSYSFIINIAFYHFKGSMFGLNDCGAFDAFRNTSQHFEDFVYGDQSQDKAKEKDTEQRDAKKHA
jgi:hypothetical protein